MARFVGVENPRILMATALNWYASMVCLLGPGWAKQDLWSRVTVYCSKLSFCQNVSPIILAKRLLATIYCDLLTAHGKYRVGLAAPAKSAVGPIWLGRWLE